MTTHSPQTLLGKIQSEKEKRDRFELSISKLKTDLDIYIDLWDDTDTIQERYNDVIELSDCLLPTEVLTTWQSDITKTRSSHDEKICEIEGKLEKLNGCLETSINTINALVATPLSGDECHITKLPSELLEIIFAFLPRYGYVIEQTCVLFRNMIRMTGSLKTLKIRNRVYRTDLTFRVVKLPIEFNPDVFNHMVAGGDGNVWIHRGRTAVGTSVKTGKHTDTFIAPLSHTHKLVAVSSGGAMIYYSFDTKLFFCDHRETHISDIKLSGIVVGATSDTSVLISRCVKLDGRYISQLVIVDITNTANCEIIFEIGSKIKSVNNGLGATIGWIQDENFNGASIEYNDPKTITPTNYATSSFSRWCTPIPQSNCIIDITEHSTIEISDHYDWVDSFITNTPNIKNPVLVTVGNCIVMACDDNYYMY
jgi:hypothetical protein